MISMRRAGFVLGLALAGLIAVGCRGGTYPVDIFPEMHYQQSYKSYEPPRLSSVAEAVPITGKAVPLTIPYSEAGNLKDPYPKSAEMVARGAALYAVNCAMCHGVNADGQSYIADRLQQAGAVRPPAFNSDRIRARSEGQLYYAITNGFGFMPPFGKLLSDEDRWALEQFEESRAHGQ